MYIYRTHLTNPRMQLCHIPQCNILWQKCAHSVTKWCIVGYSSDALWDLWYRWGAEYIHEVYSNHTLGFEFTTWLCYWHRICATTSNVSYYSKTYRSLGWKVLQCNQRRHRRHLTSLVALQITIVPSESNVGIDLIIIGWIILWSVADLFDDIQISMF